MNRAVPMDFSYTRSESSGTSIPADPAERVVSEKPCPILSASCWTLGRFRGGTNTSAANDQTPRSTWSLPYPFIKATIANTSPENLLRAGYEYLNHSLVTRIKLSTATGKTKHVISNARDAPRLTRAPLTLPHFGGVNGK